MLEPHYTSFKSQQLSRIFTEFPFHLKDKLEDVKCSFNRKAAEEEGMNSTILHLSVILV
jgi:hypothetical protein